MFKQPVGKQQRCVSEVKQNRDARLVSTQVKGEYRSQVNRVRADNIPPITCRCGRT